MLHIFVWLMSALFLTYSAVCMLDGREMVGIWFLLFNISFILTVILFYEEEEE